MKECSQCGLSNEDGVFQCGYCQSKLIEAKPEYESHPVKNNCVICNLTCRDAEILSNGSVYHKDCYEKLHEKIKEIDSRLYKFNQEVFQLEHEIHRAESVFGRIRNFLGGYKPDIEANRFRIKKHKKEIERLTNNKNEVNNILKRLYDYWPQYPPDWDERKDKVISRDGDTCSECGSRRHLHFHHVIPLSRGGSNKISNLKLLCEKHHSEKHFGRDFTDEFSDTETAFSKRVSNIRHAIKQGKKMEFGYKKPSDRGYKKRTIRPIRLKNIPHNSGSGSTLCVDGFCELRQADRTFALKRMRGLKIVYE